MSYNKLCCTSSLPGQWDVMMSLSTFCGVCYKRATWMPHIVILSWLDVSSDILVQHLLK
jgi:hypothetical protein